MKESMVRLTKISIKGFKNVRNGNLSLINHRKNYRASVLALYGQNGSGKTALIDALHLLKMALVGERLPSEAADFIQSGEEAAELSYTFTVELPSLPFSGTYEAVYSFRLCKDDPSQTPEENALSPDAMQEAKPHAVIEDEKLQVSFDDGEQKLKKSVLMDASVPPVFGPKTKYRLLFQKDPAVKQRLLVAKGVARKMSTSFLFSRDLFKELYLQAKTRENDKPFTIYSQLLSRLRYYAISELFVIQTSTNGAITMDVLPFAFSYREGKHGIAGQIPLRMVHLRPIPKDMADAIQKVIESMNLVLNQIVPGLTVHIHDLGPQMTKNGKEGELLQFMSCRNGREIPLQYESDGIKKIFSILNLLIIAYNRPNITVAIDELDSGIFEYLLGELLRILTEKGKGQIIFTSHNLRPLETIDRGFIAFTTTNPDHRYLRFTHVKENNNLRDFYYRDIVLGEQQEEVYEPTHNAEIALAFREAGEQLG